MNTPIFKVRIVVDSEIKKVEEKMENIWGRLL